MAEQGDAWPQNSLGNLYYDARRVPQNYQQAVRWFRKAAEQGHTDAQNSLGNLYADGNGVPQDYVKAHAWSNLAAAQDPSMARFRDQIVSQMTRPQIDRAQELAAKLARSIDR